MVMFSILFSLIVIIFIDLYIYPDKIKSNLKFVKHNRASKLIFIVFGTRPEIIKLYPIIHELKNVRFFSYKIICTYQQEEMVKQILDDFHIYPDIALKVMEKNQPLSLLSSKLFIQLEEVYKREVPDITIVQGDTTTSLIASICSFYHKVPVAHIEAGLRTRKIYFPFPEELNRQTISNIAKYNFCPTKLSAQNLLMEKRESSSIHIVGNTVVDTLRNSYELLNENKNVKNIKKYIDVIYKDKSIKHIILLTVHRRENFGDPFVNIMKAVFDLIKKYNNIVFIYPLHLNPNVKLSLEKALPSHILNKIMKNKKIDENDSYSYLNRLKVIKPLSYFPLIYLLNHSYFIMTDSGGIQEESVALKKPILILRNTTERMEGVLSKSAILVGTEYNDVYNNAEQLLINQNKYKSMIKNPNIYGDGTAAKKIVNILKSNDKGEEKRSLYNSLVIVLTVWKRNNLLMQLNLVKKQSIIKWMKVMIIVYQNYEHINITLKLNEWKRKNPEVNVVFMQTKFETGYYGRFLAPLTYFDSESYFIVCDDDVLFGSEYFENMIRVVDSGSLATRNGRFISPGGHEIYGQYVINGYITWEEDIEYDFGGHIWTGKMEWLKLVWQHPPPSLLNCEDAWMSIVLYTFYNISTKIPKCPLPKTLPNKPTMCACSDKSAGTHVKSALGDDTISDSNRWTIMKMLKKMYNFTGMMERNYTNYQRSTKLRKQQNNSIYEFKDDIMGRRCLYYV